jgi:hypothetical protein
VSLDIKHLINRIISECRTESRLFKNFSLELHSLFHTDVSVLSRDGTEHKINGRLRPNSELISKLNAVIRQAKTNNTSLLRNKDAGIHTKEKKEEKKKEEKTRERGEDRESPEHIQR